VVTSESRLFALTLCKVEHYSSANSAYPFGKRTASNSALLRQQRASHAQDSTLRDVMTRKKTEPANDDQIEGEDEVQLRESVDDYDLDAEDAEPDERRRDPLRKP